MHFSPDTYLRALSFAARAHADQRMPNKLPYVAHLSAVCMELICALRAEPGLDEELAVSCALLHDTLEDTAVDPRALEREFGARVLAGVRALTKNDGLPKEARMSDCLERILIQPREIAMVKLADRITNLAPPPEHWSQEKIRQYRLEAELILHHLQGASAFLKARFENRLAQYGR